MVRLKDPENGAAKRATALVHMQDRLAVFTVIDTQLSPLASRAWAKLLSMGAKFYAPQLWVYETTSVIRKLCALDKITLVEADEALIILDQMQIEFIPENLSLRQAALRWATHLHQIAAYDGFYLAVAERLVDELWTADQALVNNVRHIGASWVHWIGEIG